MKTKHPITLLALVLLLLLGAQHTLAKTWTPGVECGDYFTYQMYGVFSAHGGDAELTIPKFELNNTLWVRINVTSVSASVVTQTYTLHFENESETNYVMKTDVNPASESTQKFQSKGVPLCATNLVAGDRLPTNELHINETIRWAYGGVWRDTNRVSWNTSDDCGDCYFDKSTGALVELLRTHTFTDIDTGAYVEKTDVIRLTGTNVWQVTTVQRPMQVGSLFAILAAIILVLCLAVMATHRFFARREQITNKYRQQILLLRNKGYDGYCVCLRGSPATQTKTQPILGRQNPAA